MTSGEKSRLPTESGVASDIRNNFNLVRLMLASMVVAYHMVVLSAGPSGPGIGMLGLLAELGVQGFFVVSGYLVWLSLERSRSLKGYAEKRARRLIPGYAVVIVVTVIVALAVSAEARNSLAVIGRYAGWNLLFLNFLQPELPGIFTTNPFVEVNGALWTLKIEVMFYLVLPVLAWIIKSAGKARWLVFLVIYAGAEAWRFGLEQYGTEQPLYVEFSRQLPGQMSFFVTGIALACWRDRITWRLMMPLTGLVLATLSIAVPIFEPARAAGLGIVVIWLSVGMVRLPDAARFGDLSYGLYIVHFPIIQTAVALGLFATDPWVGVAASATTSVIAALLLWHLIEKPALRRDSAYRTSAAG